MNKDNNIYKDQLKSLFEDFEADIPIDGWDSLEESMNISKRVSITRRNWYIGSAAAVAILLISSILFINNPNPINNDLPKVSEATVTPKAPESKTYTAEEGLKNHTDLSTNEVLVASSINTNRSGKQPIKESSIEAIEDIQQEQPIAIPQPKDEVEPNYIDKEEEEEESKLSQDDIDRLIKELEESANIDLFSDDYLPKKSKQPLMLAINAKGGLTSSQSTSNSPMSLRSSNVYNSPTNDDNLGEGVNNDLVTDGISSIYPYNNTADNKAEMVHSQPYSVGITVSKNITNKLSIETGVAYTYLYSEAKNTSTAHKNRENQEIHYLGIPVNLNYNLVELGRFNVFASIGGMIEKDIYGINRNNASSTNQNLNVKSEREHSEKINLRNPQLSVNGGVGASYAIYGGMNIYAKIGGAYYFDANNHEYRTIYSDKKILLDINAGLRFQF